MQTQNWREILWYAQLAPSPHNIQSWRFKIESSTQLTLLYDPTRLLPDTDPTGRFCTVGFGILVEYMSIAAAALGLAVGCELLGDLDPKKIGLQPFAMLTLVPRRLPEPLDHTLIEQRRTSRLPYNDKPVDPALLSQLADIAAGYSHKLEFSQEPEQVSWVVALNARTMFYDFCDPLARNEVGGWIRYSMREARQKADGLAAYAMHFPGWLMEVFVNQNWLFRLPVVYQAALALYKHSIRGTTTVAWLSGPFSTTAECFEAGRMLGRLWLKMTERGVYLHPFGSVITNGKAHAEMVEHFNNPNRKNDLWLLMRLGESELPPQSKRLGLERLLVK